MYFIRSLALAAGCLLASTGCGTGVDWEPATAWEGTLVSIPPSPPLEGLIGALSRGRSTEVSIAIRAAPQTAYDWRIFSGTCTSRGALVGAVASYTEILTDSQGAGEVLTSLTRTLDRNASYHAVLYASTQPETVLACGELQRTSF